MAAQINNVLVLLQLQKGEIVFDPLALLAALVVMALVGLLVTWSLGR